MVSLFQIVLKNSSVIDDYKTLISIKKILTEYKFSKLENFHINFSINEFVIISFLNSGDDAIYKNHLYEFCSEIENSITSSFRASVNISFSSLGKSIPVINTLFKEAKKAISNTFPKSLDPIIAYEDIYFPDSIGKDIDFAELYNDTSNAIFSSDDSDVDTFINTYFVDEDDESKGVNEHTKSLTYFIMCTLETILINEHKSLNDLYGEELVIWRTLSKIENVQYYRQWIKSIFISVKNALQHEESGDWDTVNRIKSYIDEHYMENITLTDIANSVFYSVRQSNYRFKNTTGMTISDYLSEYRISKAKSLLMTNMKIRECLQ